MGACIATQSETDMTQSFGSHATQSQSPQSDAQAAKAPEAVYPPQPTDERLQYIRGEFSAERILELQQLAKDVIRRVSDMPLVEEAMMLQNGESSEPDFVLDLLETMERSEKQFWPSARKQINDRDAKLLADVTHDFKTTVCTYGGDTSLTYLLIFLQYQLEPPKDPNPDAPQPFPLNSSEENFCLYTLLLPTVFDLYNQFHAVVSKRIRAYAASCETDATKQEVDN